MGLSQVDPGRSKKRQLLFIWENAVRNRENKYAGNTDGFLRICSECQSRSCGALTVHASPVFIRCMPRSLQHRNRTGGRTVIGLFLLTADELSIIALCYTHQLIIELMMQAIQGNSDLTEDPLNQFMIVFRSAAGIHWN